MTGQKEKKLCHMSPRTCLLSQPAHGLCVSEREAKRGEEIWRHRAERLSHLMLKDKWQEHFLDQKLGCDQQKSGCPSLIQVPFHGKRTWGRMPWEREDTKPTKRTSAPRTGSREARWGSAPKDRNHLILIRASKALLPVCTKLKLCLTYMKHRLFATPGY